jgi:hypothetical protein
MYLVPIIWTNDRPCGAGSEGVTGAASFDSVLVALLDATTVSVELLKRDAVEDAIITSVVLVEDPVESIFDVVVPRRESMMPLAQAPV